MQTRLLAQRLLALFMAGWLLFDFPLLRVAAGGGLWWGLPRMAVALFGAWLLLIVCLAVLMEAGAAEPPEPTEPLAPFDPRGPSAPLAHLDSPESSESSESRDPPGMPNAPASQATAGGSQARGAAVRRGPAP